MRLVLRPPSNRTPEVYIDPDYFPDFLWIPEAEIREHLDPPLTLREPSDAPRSDGLALEWQEGEGLVFVRGVAFQVRMRQEGRDLILGVYSPTQSMDGSRANTIWILRYRVRDRFGGTYEPESDPSKRSSWERLDDDPAV